MLRIITRQVHNKAYRIVISQDEKCFVSYHPDIEHPYEHTKPLPLRQKDESILKENSKHMITKSPNLEQVQALTYTPRRHWKEYPGREKRKKYIEYFNDNVDRKGLTT